MKKHAIRVLVITLLSSWALPAWAQYDFFEPEVGFAIEVSLHNTDLQRLPIYRNAISSLAVVGDYIIGGTSAREGLTPFVFAASLSQRKVVDVEDLSAAVSGQQSIRSGFCRGPNNNVLFAGTIANKDSGEDGHLIRITVGPEGAVEVEELGNPIPGEGIFALTCNARGTMLYGISYPSGLFLSYNLTTGQAQVFDDIAPTEEELQTFETYAQGQPGDYLGGSLIADAQGRIYGSRGLNEIFYFNPDNQRFHVLEDKVPTVWGRTSLGQVESWVHYNGKLYGGTAGEGQLFVLDPSTGQVTNLGKPIMMNRIKGLAVGRDGKLYGVAGAPPGYAHLFSYDPDGEGFRDYGNPQFTMKAPGIEQGIAWRGFNFATVASSEDGRYVVMGEDEALSQLMIFVVEEK